MITLRLRPWFLSKSGAASGAPVPDRARVTWNGKDYEQIDAHGAIFGLARQLVADGCPDDQWQTYNHDGKRTLYGTSLHRLAQLTITEDERGIRRHRYKPHPGVA